MHRALEIFQRGGDGYAAPLPQPITAAQRAAAIEQLEAVSRQVFAQELDDNFEHRAWLRRWLALVAPYIDWLIGHQATWRFVDSEVDGRLELAGGRMLGGRIDRIDQGPSGTLIIDYKTGRAPQQADVDSGEAVQLPSYALLSRQPPQAVEYVLIGRINNRNTVRPGSRLEGAALASLASAVRTRLETVLAEIAAGTPLPAWGDEDTCQYCDMDGLCRRQAWPQS
ncbi:MAG: PD-(D/E)XK nuclease family protein [Pseudomonadota bacterium]